MGVVNKENKKILIPGHREEMEKSRVFLFPERCFLNEPEGWDRGLSEAIFSWWDVSRQGFFENQLLESVRE